MASILAPHPQESFWIKDHLSHHKLTESDLYHDFHDVKVILKPFGSSLYYVLQLFVHLKWFQNEKFRNIFLNVKRLRFWDFLLLCISWRYIDFISLIENIFLTLALNVCSLTFILINSIQMDPSKFVTWHQHLVNWNIKSTISFENQNWSQTSLTALDTNFSPPELSKHS